MTNELLPNSETTLLPSTRQHIKTLITLVPESLSVSEPGILTEIDDAIRRFSPIFDAVKLRYQDLETNLLPYFLAHNEEVLASAVFFNNLLNLDPIQRRIIEAAAIGHDIAKADPSPKNFPKQYALLKHPELGADVIRKMLNAQSDEFWNDVIGKGADNSSFIAQVVRAIQSHSGPIPGFMENVLGKYNIEAQILGIDAISLPQIQHNHIPSVVLLAADMIGLGTLTGVQKIISLRTTDPVFKQQDTLMATNTQTTLSEVRIQSALGSAYDGAKMTQSIMSQSTQFNPQANNIYNLMNSYFDLTKKQIIEQPA